MAKLMIVEDDAVAGLQLEESLKSMGFEVLGRATTGKEAISMAEAGTPDLILMDIVLPGEMDGIEAAEAIKNTFHIPSIFITGHTDEKWIIKAKPVEPLGYILKPISDHQVKAVIEIALYRIQIEKKLKESEIRFQQIAKLSPFPISIVESDGSYSYLNEKFIEVFGYTLEDIPSGREWFRKAFPDPEIRKKAISAWQEDLKHSKAYETRNREFKITCKNGEIRHIVICPVSLENKRQFITYEDLTVRKEMEETLRKEKNKLERMVEKRTEELKIKTLNLEDANEALKNIIKKREEDRNELEEKVQLNVRRLVLPYVEKLKNTHLDSDQEIFVEIIDTGLKEILSPFSHALSTRYINLTPKEVEIANLIKQGKSTREISVIFGLSKRTIDAHRNHIRRKLGMKKKGGNLRTHLFTIR
ncbi:MAG: response regulator [Thermodesulfobacteriota bacterium]